MIRRSREKIFLLSLLCLLFLIPACSPTLAGDEAIVRRVVDGDTIVVFYQGKEEKVRLIGVNTPETKDPRRPVEYFGKEASAFTIRLLPPGTRVQLEFDWEKRDKYGRMVPGGQSYDKVAPENRVYFDSEEEAKRAGYRRARR